MESPTESPIPIFLLGLILFFIFAVFYAQTRKMIWLWLLAAPITLAGLAVAIDWMFQSDREAITERLEGAVAALKANDLDETLSYISPEAKQTRVLTEMGLTKHHVSFARIRSVDIQVNRSTRPPSAQVSFIGSGSGHFNDGDFQGISAPVTVDVLVPYRLENDKWMIGEPVKYEIVSR